MKPSMLIMLVSAINACVGCIAFTHGEWRAGATAALAAIVCAIYCVAVVVSENKKP